MWRACGLDCGVWLSGLAVGGELARGTGPQSPSTEWREQARRPQWDPRRITSVDNERARRSPLMPRRLGAAIRPPWLIRLIMSSPHAGLHAPAGPDQTTVKTCPLL